MRTWIEVDRKDCHRAFTNGMLLVYQRTDGARWGVRVDEPFGVLSDGYDSFADARGFADRLCKFINNDTAR